MRWLVVTLLAATALGVLWRWQRGRLRGVSAEPPLDPGFLDELGVTLGRRATLVQFSSAFCAPCRATRTICGQVVAALDGVTHIEVDAESHLEAVRRLGVARTPTVLVLDRTGVIVRRGSGQPRADELLAAVEAAVDGVRS